MKEYDLEKIYSECFETEYLGNSAAAQCDLEEINSPIEKIFYTYWFKNNLNESLGYLDKQKKIDRFFVDFSIDFLGYYQCSKVSLPNKILELIKLSVPKVAIEIDGHDWHEKTKQQVESDKKRERFLISKGWSVIRFSGSEVYKKPNDCVLEIKEIFKDVHNDIFAKILNKMVIK